MCLETLQSHPLDGQLDSALVVDAVIFFVVNISSKAEICHLYCVVLIQPDQGKKELSYVG